MPLTRLTQRLKYAADRAEADYKVAAVAGACGLKGIIMDPQATWDELQDAIRRGDQEITRERALSLLGWLARGGFPPGDIDRSSHGF
jgi:hypothetical protein